MKPNKFRARKVTANGITFDSRAEYARYCDLELLQRAGVIRELKVHPKFDLSVNGTLVGTFKPDFSYVHQTGAVVIEDVKSKASMTEASSLRIRLFQALYNLPVTIIGKNAAKVRSFK